ncbi:MAG: hypothetical protein LAO08_01230 [Acidobacteriia bacterium]|nr:hypothetical protein [Terriglobia bacterium]
MPDGPAFGTQNLRVSVEGKEILPEHSSIVDPRMMRAAFDPIWEQKQRSLIVTEWDMAPKSSARGSVAATAEGFYIADETALPIWQTPAGIFSVGASDPERELLTVLAPADFRILAPGKALKRAKGAAGNMVSQGFRIRPDKDFLPYVIAGRYQELVIREREGAVSFWTFRPVDPQAANTAAARLASSMHALSDYFGPLPNGKAAVHIVESPGDLPIEFGSLESVPPEGLPAPSQAPGAIADPAYGGNSFPAGALLDSRAVAQGVADENVLQLAEYELARTWFGWRVRPTPEAQILMGRGVGLFGLVVAAESRGPDQRRAMIVSLLERYDRARAVAPDRRLMEPPFGYSRAERISTGYRGALLLVALEDLCGHDALREAFRQIVRSRAGEEAGYEELRAAAESASGRDLAEFFRRWLNQPGVPEELRGRYAQL